MRSMVEGAYCAEACREAETPSTTLLRSAVPLPRFAGRMKDASKGAGVNRVAETLRRGKQILSAPAQRGRGTMQSMVEGACCAEASLPAEAPSTTLLRSAVPLPRFAGQDEDTQSKEAGADVRGNATLIRPPAQHGLNAPALRFASFGLRMLPSLRQPQRATDVRQ